MKFWYCDESGMRGKDQWFIAVGIVTDASRINHTKEAMN
jgi:hypothetical protein